MDSSSPQAIYRAEKAKALRERRISHVQLMAEAQEAFKKLLADAAIARKGGRPKSVPAAAGAAAKPAPAKPAPAKAVVVVEAEAVAVEVVKGAAKPAAKAPPARSASRSATQKASAPVKATTKKAPARAKPSANGTKAARTAAKTAKAPAGRGNRVRAKTVAKKHTPVKAGARSTIRKKR